MGGLNVAPLQGQAGGIGCGDHAPLVEQVGQGNGRAGANGIHAVSIAEMARVGHAGQVINE